MSDSLQLQIVSDMMDSFDPQYPVFNRDITAEDTPFGLVYLVNKSDRSSCKFKLPHEITLMD